MRRRTVLHLLLLLGAHMHPGSTCDVTHLGALVPVLLKLNEAAFDELTIPVKNGYSSETISGMMVLVPNLNKNQDAIAEFLETDTAE